MKCNFIDCCIDEDTWVECQNCGRKFITLKPAKDFNNLEIYCEPKDTSKSIVLKAKIIEMGDNKMYGVDVPQLYLEQETGNRILLDVDRGFLIDLVRGKGDKFSVYEDINLKLTISK